MKSSRKRKAAEVLALLQSAMKCTAEDLLRKEFETNASRSATNTDPDGSHVDEEATDSVASGRAAREHTKMQQNVQPVKAPTHAVSVKIAADHAFKVNVLVSTSAPSDCEVKFERSQLVEVDSQGVPRPLRGHMLKILQHHIY